MNWQTTENLRHFWHMLGENCPVVSSTSEASDISYTEQNETPRENKTPEKIDPSVENQPSAESRIWELLSIQERTEAENSSTDGTGVDSDSGSTSESRDEDGSEFLSSVPETPLQKPVTSTPHTNLTSKSNPSSVENKKSHVSTKSIQQPDSQKPKLKALRDFKTPHLDRKLNSTGNIDKILSKVNLTVTLNKIDLTKEVITIILDLLDNKTNKDYLNVLTSHTVRLQTYHTMSHLPEELDDILYGTATRKWPDILPIISDKTH